MPITTRKSSNRKINMTENTTASGAADRVNAYLDRRATMRGIDKDVIHGMDGPDFELTVSDLRALAASAPVAPTLPAPMPYPTDAQIDAVYEQTMGQHLRSQDAPAVRRFGRAMFLCAWNAATPAVAPEPPTQSKPPGTQGLMKGAVKRVGQHSLPL